MKLVERFSMRSAAKFMPITLGACAAVVCAAVVMTNLSFPDDGKGGLDSTSPSKESAEDLALLEVNGESEILESGSVSEIPSNLESSGSCSLSYFSYRIKEGDIVGKLAERFDITSDSILSLNHINNARGLQIGQYLKIPTMSGILYTTGKGGESVAAIAEKYEVDAQKFADANKVALDASLGGGMTVFVPDAKLDWETRQKINGDLFLKPIHAKWRQSSSFGWRSNPFTGARSYHSGVDMACPTGTSVYAASTGIVSSTGFSPVYGNFVIVTHHSGYQTLYGHMSAILCVKGQSVDSSTRIGKVGSTGMSTGPHLHFTVYKNKVAVNPVALWN